VYFILYERESVKHVIFEPEKKITSRHILHQHWYTCPIALPVHRNPLRRCLFDCCLSHFRISVSTSSSLREFLDAVVNCFTRQTLPTVNKRHFFMNILCIWVLLPTKKHNRTLLFGSILQTLKPQAWGPPFVGCPQLIIQYIRSYPSLKNDYMY
jgi:hypothetical protein